MKVKLFNVLLNKHTYLFLLFTLFSSSNLFSQDQCGSNAVITTNPDNPVNQKDTDPPTRLNNFFDWRVEDIPIFSNSPYHSGFPYIQSPFWDNNALYKNYVFKNYKPEDGWELIKVIRGYVDRTNLDVNNTPVQVPGSFSLTQQQNTSETTLWLVLYNKYTAVLRVLVSCKQYMDYTGARIKLSFSRANNNIFTNLIRSPETLEPLIPVDYIPEIKSIAVPAYFDNNPNRWLYADFPLMYDPCTCLFQSELTIEVRMINNSSITLTGLLEGTIVDIQDKNGGQGILDNKGVFGIDDLHELTNQAYQSYQGCQSFVDKTTEVLDKLKRKEAELISEQDLSGISDEELEDWIINYISTHPGYNGIEMAATKDRNTEQKSALDNFISDIAGADWLRTGLSAVPYVGAAMSVVDFFTGGKNVDNTQTVRIQPMAINAKIEIEGNIEQDIPYDNITLKNPGCNNINLVAGEENTAYYDNVLGTFNVLETPKVDCYNNRLFEWWPPPGEFGPPYLLEDDLRYKLAEPIKFVINPAAGFKMNPEDMDIMAAFIFEFDESVADARYMQFLDEIIIRESLTSYRTRYVPIECFSDVKAIFKSGYYQWFYYNMPPLINMPKVYVKLIVNLKRIDATPLTENVLFVGKYPVKIEYHTGVEHLGWEQEWVSNLLNKPKNIVLSNTTVQSNVYAWETITIGPNVTSQGGPYIIKAGKEIIVEPNSSFDPNLVLQIGTEGLCEAEKYGPVLDISSFCNDATKYRYQQRSWGPTKKVGLNNVEKINNFNLAVYPNPFSSSTTITITLPEADNVNLAVFDMLGRKIYEFANSTFLSAGEHRFTLESQNLESGMFYVNFATKNNYISKPLILVK